MKDFKISRNDRKILVLPLADDIITVCGALTTIMFSNKVMLMFSNFHNKLLIVDFHCTYYLKKNEGNLS